MKIEQKATIIAMITAFFLTIIKMIIGVISGSIAIISSAVDSLLDMLVSFFNVIAVHNASKNPDKNFNYGRGKLEALAAFIEGAVILVSAIFILKESIIKFQYGEKIAEFGLAFGVMIFSFLVTLVLVIFLSKIAKKTKNLVILSDVLHYKTDLLTNSGIIIAMIIIFFTDFHQIDAIIGAIIALYIAYNSIEIIRKWFLLLMDVALDDEKVAKITEIIENESKVTTFHEFRTRESGKIKFVEAHLVFNPEISLLEAHNISHKIEDKIREIDTESNWSILFHLDPYNDEIEDKKYREI